MKNRKLQNDIDYAIYIEKICMQKFFIFYIYVLFLML